MATDVLFNLYDIMVNQVFGSVFLSILAMAGLLLIIMFICKMSSKFIILWAGTYLITMFILYTGGLGLVIAYILAIIYLARAIIKLVIQWDIG